MIKISEKEAMDSYMAIQVGSPENAKTADLHTMLIKKAVENGWFSPEGQAPRAFGAYDPLHQSGCYNIITSANQSLLCVNSKGGEEGMTCTEIEEEGKESDKGIRKPIFGDTISAQAMNRSWIFLSVKEYSGVKDTVSFVANLFKAYWSETNKESPVPMWRHLFPYGKMGRLVRKTFLPTSISEPLMDILRHMQNRTLALYKASREDILSNSTGFLDKALDMLDSYYDLLRFFLRNTRDLRKGFADYPAFLRMALGLGCNFFREKEGGYVGQATPFAPRYLLAILETQRQLKLLNGRGESEQARKARAEVLNTFLARYLRWFVMTPDGKLGQAVACTYTDNPIEREHPCVFIRTVSSYSSYEGINELRLFEKVIYELEKRMDPENYKAGSFNLEILLAGDLNPGQMYTFSHLLQGWLEKVDEPLEVPETKRDFSRVHLHFWVFTKNQADEEQIQDFQQDPQVSVSFDKYENLFGNPAKLKKQIGHADLLFFLDCCSLYEDLYAEPYDRLDALLQQISGQDFRHLYRRMQYADKVLSVNRDTPDQNPFCLVENLALGAAYGDGTPAALKKRVNDVILDFIEEQLYADGPENKKTTYLYYSDLHAAQELHWREDHFIRREQYGGKNMAIFRYGKNSDEKLKEVGKSTGKAGEHLVKPVIVFNLWQFIKHSNLHAANERLGLFGFCNKDGHPDEKKIHLLAEILVGIDYREWPERLTLSYAYPQNILKYTTHKKEAFDATLRGYLNSIVLPCFDRKNDDMYYRYFRVCMCSFLYSDAKSIDDLLFLHVFKNKFYLLGDAELQNSLDDGDEYENLVKQCSFSKGANTLSLKYSQKRFYQEIMSDYDSPAEYFPNQYRKLEIMEKNGKLKPQEAFLKVQEACTRNKYKDSYLYRNCVERS